MSARLASGIWVSAYVLRLQLAGIPVYVTAKGDETAGAVVVKVATLDGRARAFQRSFDPMSGARVWTLRHCQNSEFRVPSGRTRPTLRI